MKFITTLFLGLFLTGTAYALEPVELGELCRSISFDNKKIECLEAADGKYTDGYAVAVCASISFDNKKIDCVRAIAGKEYGEDIASICYDISFDNKKIECLERSGNEDSGDGGKLVRALRSVIRAVGALIDDNKNRARRHLDRASDILDR